MPGYPAFLAAISAFAGKSTRAVMLAQAVVDLATCLLIALIAARLAPESSRRRVALAGLWLAALCPFTANYTAVVLTETLVTFLTALACWFCSKRGLGMPDAARPGAWHAGSPVSAHGFSAGSSSDLGHSCGRKRRFCFSPRARARWQSGGGRPTGGNFASRPLLMASGFCSRCCPGPRATGTRFTTVQFLAPRYSELPGEFAPLGFNAWTNTWLWRFRDVYLVTWKLDVEAISIDDIPRPPSILPNERARVAQLFEQYNDTPDARPKRGSRARRNRPRDERPNIPLRTYLKIPLLRSLTIWFTPRVELLPYLRPSLAAPRGMAGRPQGFRGDARSGPCELRLSSRWRWRAHGSRGAVRDGRS